MRRPRTFADLDELLSERAEWVNGCLLWRGHVNTSGYAQVNLDKKYQLLHRAIWAASRGEIPERMVVCHRCDTPRCLNIEHLFLGTQADNVRDMESKGRGRRAEGEANPNATISDEKVRTIRRLLRDGHWPGDLAFLFGVCKQTIYNIRNSVTRAGAGGAG